MAILYIYFTAQISNLISYYYSFALFYLSITYTPSLVVFFVNISLTLSLSMRLALDKHLIVLLGVVAALSDDKTHGLALRGCRVVA